MSAIGAATVEALIFDLDGLLVDSESLNEDVLQTLLREHDCQIEWTAEQVEALIGRRMPEVLAVIAGICNITAPVDALNASFEELRLVVLRGRLQTMPGAKELIDHGRAAGLRLALATSGRRDYVDAVLTETGLAGWFDAEVTGEEVNRGKPDPVAYLLAAQRLEIDAGACIVFEDAPNGIAAAVAAGMRAVAVPNVYTRDLPFRVAPEASLPDLHAAIPWLKRHMLTTDALMA